MSVQYKSEEVAQCQCEMAGYCARHRMIKDQRQFEACRSSEIQRVAWDLQARRRNDDRACMCPGPGFCERHGMSKTRDEWLICQRDEKQRTIWDFIATTGRSPNGTRPSFLRLIGNFTMASIRHLADGGRQVTDEVLKQRVAICHRCPSRRFNGKSCEHLGCGCAVNEKRFASKLAWASERCPDGHWEAVPPESLEV